MNVKMDITSEGNVSFRGRPILFFKKVIGNTDQYFGSQDIKVKETDCGWTFQVPATNLHEVIGVMIPVQELEVIVGDTPLDLYKSKKHYYAPERELERILELNPHDFNNLDRPIVHMIDKDQAFAWSCPNECIISSFVHQYQWCINFTVIACGDSVTFFLDQSSNYIINLQRYPPIDREVLINETTSVKSMQNALLSGAKPRNHPNHPHTFIRETRSVQLELKKRHLDSVIIGSLARRLNSVPVDIGDIDLMVENEDKLHGAIDVLESFADRISLHDMHAKFTHKDCTIDVCYDNYNILAGSSHIINRHGLTYLGAEGLLWLYMINLFSCEMDEHSDDYKDHINNAITSLYRIHKFGEFDIIPYGKVAPDYSKACSNLCLLLSEAQIEYRDIRINKPFIVRSFSNKDEFFYIIVNQGSCCDAELVIDQIPSTVIWADISGKTKTIIPTIHQSFSIVHIPQISLPGVLRCLRSQ